MFAVSNLRRKFVCLYAAVFTAGLLAVTSDSTATWSSPVLIKLNKTGPENPFRQPITANQASLIGSLNTLGAFFGPLPCMLAADYFGRKTILLLMALPHAASYLMLAFSKNIFVYYFARFLGGFAVGSSYTVLPVYIAEIAENKNRGMLSTFVNVFCAVGDLIPYVVGPYLSLVSFNLILFAIPVVFFCLFLICAPESPYYLMQNNKEDKAKTCLTYVRNYTQKELDEEINSIKHFIENDDKRPFTELFTKKINLKALAIPCALTAFAQFSGNFAVIYYTQTIFELSGSSLPSDVSSIIIGIVILIGTLITPFVVDKLGRRVLLIISAAGMIISEGALAIYLITSNSSSPSSLTWIPILSLMIYILTYSVGFSMLPLTIMSEIFPANVKSVAASTVMLVTYATGFLVTNFFNDLCNAIGMGGSFFVFTCSNVLALVFVVFCLPETKGKSFEEIQEKLKGKVVL